MSSSAIRAFATSSRNALKVVGGTQADIIAHNPTKNGEKVWQGIKAVEAEAEERASAILIFLLEI